MGYADLHIHSVHSFDCTSSVPAVLQYAADQTNLNVIAITDHDEITGALEAMELAPLYGIEVIVGSEISTADGHLLAFDINQRIPAGLPLLETILSVRKLGGFCIAPHPVGRRIHDLRLETIRTTLVHPEAAQTLLGIEIFNIIPVLAEALLSDLTVSWVGNSNAHMLWRIGVRATEFPGNSAVDLRQALRERTTKVHSLELTQISAIESFMVSDHPTRESVMKY